MADLSSLAPLIFGGAFALAGAVSLWWMNNHATQLPRRLIESTVFGVPRKVSDKQKA